VLVDRKNETRYKGRLQFLRFTQKKSQKKGGKGQDLGRKGGVT